MHGVRTLHIVIHKHSIIIVNSRLKPTGQPTTTLHGWAGHTSHVSVSIFLLLSARQSLPNGFYNVLIKHYNGKSPRNWGFNGQMANHQTNWGSLYCHWQMVTGGHFLDTALIGFLYTNHFLNQTSHLASDKPGDDCTSCAGPFFALIYT